MYGRRYGNIIMKGTNAGIKSNTRLLLTEDINIFNPTLPGLI